MDRKLSSKVLQEFGCTADIAVDRQVAADKMDLERYDLVLMVSGFYVVLSAATLTCS